MCICCQKGDVLYKSFAIFLQGFAKDPSIFGLKQYFSLVRNKSYLSPSIVKEI